jgi:DNA-binding transcriptional MerR regulator
MGDDAVEVGELLRITGITSRQLERWRDAGLIPRPQPAPLPGGGTVSRYPPGTAVQARRIQELQRGLPRSLNEVLVALWIEAYAVDVRAAVAKRLKAATVTLASPEVLLPDAVKMFAHRDMKDMRGKQHLFNRLTDRVRQVQERAELCDGRWQSPSEINLK